MKGSSVVAVASANVCLGGFGKVGPVGIIGSVDDSFDKCPEVAFDSAEATGVGSSPT